MSSKNFNLIIFIRKRWWYQLMIVYVCINIFFDMCTWALRTLPRPRPEHNSGPHETDTRKKSTHTKISSLMCCVGKKSKIKRRRRTETKKFDFYYNEVFISILLASYYSGFDIFFVGFRDRICRASSDSLSSSFRPKNFSVVNKRSRRRWWWWWWW